MLAEKEVPPCLLGVGPTAGAWSLFAASFFLFRFFRFEVGEEKKIRRERRFLEHSVFEKRLLQCASPVFGLLKRRCWEVEAEIKAEIKAEVAEEETKGKNGGG